MTQWFKDSRASKNKICQTRNSKRWDQLKLAVEVLRKAQKDRVKSSKNGRRVQIIDDHQACERVSKDGRILVRPPLVGRDAANLQESLDKRGYSTVILCREPRTQVGLCPIVTLGATTTVRSQVEEPKNIDAPTAEWFDFAVGELGRTVVERVDTLATNDRKLDYLIGHLNAVPSCDKLYCAIVDICNALIEAKE